jgi:hypothetical protein
LNSQGLNSKIFTMKNKYLLFTLFFVQSLFGQQTPPNCPPNPSANTQEFCEEGKGIITNPDDLQNPECPDMKNNFDCGKAVVVTPNDFIGFSFHDNFNNSEFLADLASSSDWEELFGSVLFEGNETHENIKTMLMDQDYESVDFESHNNVNYYVFKDAEDEPIYSLRLIFEE